MKKRREKEVHYNVHVCVWGVCKGENMRERGRAQGCVREERERESDRERD